MVATADDTGTQNTSQHVLAQVGDEVLQSRDFVPLHVQGCHAHFVCVRLLVQLDLRLQQLSLHLLDLCQRLGCALLLFFLPPANTRRLCGCHVERTMWEGGGWQWQTYRERLLLLELLQRLFVCEELFQAEPASDEWQTRAQHQSQSTTRLTP